MLDSNKKSVRKFTIPNVESDSNDSASGKHDSLGTDVIEGLQVEGTRITRTLPIGDSGNERPIEIVVEAWYSRELQTILLRKTSDPRVGDTVYRLTNITRVEVTRYSRFPPTTLLGRRALSADKGGEE